MKKLLILFLLIASPAFAVDESKVSGPDTLFGGGGGCTTDCIFGSVRADTGAYTNISTVNLWASTAVYSPLVKNLTGNLGISTAASPGDYTFSISDPASAVGAFAFSTFGDFVADKKEWVLTHTASDQQNITGFYTMMSIEPKYNQTIAPNDSANTDLAITRTETSVGSGEQSYIKATGGPGTFRVGNDGSIEATGQSLAYRNLSSATETLTGADHTIFCLANDNDVVVTMPTCSGSANSQQLMIVYTDSGSTNKCKLDGDGAETVAGFTVYSGLDTFEEGCHFACDGSGNWWRVGCF